VYPTVDVDWFGVVAPLPPEFEGGGEAEVAGGDVKPVPGSFAARPVFTGEPAEPPPCEAEPADPEEPDGELTAVPLPCWLTEKVPNPKLSGATG
jgi:hypothetical protein